MSKRILETERLYLREITPADAPDMYALNLDPEVIQFTGDPPFASVAATEEFIRNYSDYARNGFGRWAVVRKTDDQLLGWCGLKRDPETLETDIGYRFFKRYWNQGYASEAARACLEFGFNTLNLQTIVARAMHQNKASIRVMEKIGMHFWKEDTCAEEPGIIYKMEQTELVGSLH